MSESVDTRLLSKLEAIIDKGLTTFAEVGNALIQIREERLYREVSPTFEGYCQERWGFTARRAGQLMTAAEIGTIVPVANEGQARELAPLKDKPHELRAVVAAATARSESGKVTAAAIREEVQKVVKPKVDPEIAAQRESLGLPPEGPTRALKLESVEAAPKPTKARKPTKAELKRAESEAAHEYWQRVEGWTREGYPDSWESLLSDAYLALQTCSSLETALELGEVFDRSGPPHNWVHGPSIEMMVYGSIVERKPEMDAGLAKTIERIKKVGLELVASADKIEARWKREAQ